MKVKHLDHVNLSVRDFDETVEWYAKIFGFVKVEESLQDGDLDRIVGLLGLESDQDALQALLRADTPAMLYALGVRFFKLAVEAGSKERLMPSWAQQRPSILSSLPETPFTKRTLALAHLFDELAEIVEEHLDLTKLLDMSLTTIGSDKISLPPPCQSGVRLGVARDEAFCFYYQDNLDLLTHFGAELIFFSPVRDPHLPKNLAGLYLGGGYPELYAQQLTQNESLRTEILAAAHSGMPIFAECGGFMYLTRSIRVQNRTYGMVGLYPFETRMLPSRKALGYREVILRKDSLLGPKGLRVRGHEFHYSELVDRSRDIPNLFQVSSRRGIETVVDGFAVHNVLAGYIHLHFGSNPEVAANLVDSSRDYQEKG